MWFTTTPNVASSMQSDSIVLLSKLLGPLHHWNFMFLLCLSQWLGEGKRFIQVVTMLDRSRRKIHFQKQDCFLQAAKLTLFLKLVCQICSQQSVISPKNVNYLRLLVPFHDRCQSFHNEWFAQSIVFFHNKLAFRNVEYQISAFHTEPLCWSAAGASRRSASYGNIRKFDGA